MTPEEFFLGHPILTTQQFALATKIRADSAARALKDYAKSGFIVRVTRGVWANPKHSGFSAYGLVPLLLGSEQGYISFLSALHRHGVISQIPQKIFVATTGHSRKLTSPLGEFDFIQLNPRYMRWGVEWLNAPAPYGLASPEKALLDCLYISTRKGRRFLNFPELDFESINKKKFLQLLKEHGFPSIVEAKVRQRFEALASGA